jgi:ATP-dependent Lon protease
MQAVIIPEANQVDLDDVPGYVKSRLKIYLAHHLDQVLQWVLIADAVPIEAEGS